MACEVFQRIKSQSVWPLLLGLLVFGVFTAPAEEPPREGAAARESYLLGMMGGAHVVVLHDYLELLEHRWEAGRATTEVEERLNFLTAHCGRLIAELEGGDDVAAGAPGPHADLTVLLKLVQKEAFALQDVLTSPTGDSRQRYRTLRQATESRLRDLTAAPGPTSPAAGRPEINGTRIPTSTGANED